MSRRMLLEDDYSENGLMPVMDGLIGWYDAKYRSDDNDYLIDRSGNENNISCKAKNCILNSDNIDVVGNTDSNPLDFSACINKEFSILYYIDATKSLNTGGTWSNQLKCMSGDYKDNFWWWIRPDTNMMNVWYKNNKIIDDHDNKIKMPKEKIMIAVIINSTKVDMYMNGVLLVSNSFNNNIDKITLSLFGHMQYNNCKTYKYYSSYVYNRALTKEEIQQNYLYEQSIERGE